MSKRVIHTGRKSWWNGTLRTDCGLIMPAGTFEREGFLDRLFSSGTECRACREARR